MSFFPHDLEIVNVQSPLDILSEAKNEWDAEGQGVIKLLVVEGRSTIPATTPDIVYACIRVYAQHIPTERIEHLLTVIHVCDKPYPARIELVKEDIPANLRKERFVPARSGGLLSSDLFKTLNEAAPAHTVSEEWVCQSPGEFRKQLAKALTRGSVKSAITNIIAASTKETDPSSPSALSIDDTGEEDLEGTND